MKFVKIKCIKYLKYKHKVFDIVGIPDNHNFVANDMVVHNCDEAIRFAGSSDHNKTESRELKKLFTVIRPKRFWFFFNIPDMLSLDSKYREGLSSFWIRMIERGTGVLFEKNKGETDDHYEIKTLQKTLGVVKYFTSMNKIKNSVRRHPCYFDTFKFPELSEEVYDNYELVRNAVNLKREVEERQFNQKDFAKIISYNLINNWDRIQIGVNRNKENKMTYKLLSEEVFADPVNRLNLVSDVTLRSWVYGVEKYLLSKGEKVDVFDGGLEKPEVVEAKPIIRKEIEI